MPLPYAASERKTRIKWTLNKEKTCLAEGSAGDSCDMGLRMEHALAVLACDERTRQHCGLVRGCLRQHTICTSGRCRNALVASTCVCVGCTYAGRDGEKVPAVGPRVVDDGERRAACSKVGIKTQLVIASCPHPLRRFATRI